MSFLGTRWACPAGAICRGGIRCMRARPFPSGRWGDSPPRMRAPLPPLSKRRVLLVDNYDSFTWNLAHDLGRTGAAVAVHRLVEEDDRRALG